MSVQFEDPLCVCSAALKEEASQLAQHTAGVKRRATILCIASVVVCAYLVLFLVDHARLGVGLPALAPSLTSLYRSDHGHADRTEL